MSIPKKQSRLIQVGSRRYRWRVRGRVTESQGVADSNLALAIEGADSAGGSVLVAELPGLHPSNWLDLPGISVTPKLVTRIIRQALEEGWQPGAQAPSFESVSAMRLRIATAARPNARPRTHW
jgi:hypothetical protein